VRKYRLSWHDSEPIGAQESVGEDQRPAWSPVLVASTSSKEARTMAQRRPVEWPTVVVAVVIHGAWLATLMLHRHAPLAAVVAVLAMTIAWHGSLQHEVIHGHPFHRRTIDDALGSLPLSLWVPYPLYRRSHLAHHASAHLTDPVEDTESFYVSTREWAQLSRLGRAVLVTDRTFLGRLVIGPALVTWRFARLQLDQLRRGDAALARCWLVHTVAVVALVLFVAPVCGLPLWQYLLAVYGARSLQLVRSFCEHRYVDGDASRSAVVHAGRFFRLLFLNNNLHHAHHARPGAPWYRIPAIAADLGSDRAAAQGAGWYGGYRDVARRYLVQPLDHPVHPHRVQTIDAPIIDRFHRVPRSRSVDDSAMCDVVDWR
jgi:fatty acid desaturase